MTDDQKRALMLAVAALRIYDCSPMIAFSATINDPDDVLSVSALNAELDKLRKDDPEGGFIRPLAQLIRATPMSKELLDLRHALGLDPRNPEN